MLPVIKDEIKTFLQNTTVKGIPRMMSAQLHVLKLLWLLAVLLGGGFAIYFFYQLLILFVSGETFLVTRKVNLKDLQPVSPTLSLCNMNLLGNSGVTAEDVQNYIDFVQRSLDDTETNFMRETLQQLLTNSAIFENLVHDGAREEIKDYIVSCNVSYLCSGKKVIVPCQNVWTWDVYQSFLGKCVTIDTSKYGTCAFNHLSALLYADSFIDMNLPIQEEMNILPLTDASLLLIGAPGTTPSFYDDLVVHIYPGESAGIFLDVIKTIYSEAHLCTDDDTIPFSSCVSASIQKRFMKHCGCVHSDIPSNAQLRNGSKPCGLVLEHRGSVKYTQMTCQEILSNVMSAAFDQCRMMCSELSYTAMDLRFPWPHPSQQMAFWDKYIRNQSYEGHLQEHMERRKDWYLNGTLAYMEPSDLITQNFLQVNVQFQSSMITEEVYTLAMPLQNFIGNMGGIFNLWIGVSFISVIELIEVLMKITSKLFHKNDQG